MKLVSKAVLAQRKIASFHILMHPLVISFLLLGILLILRDIHYSAAGVRKTAQALFILMFTTLLLARVCGSYGYASHASHILTPSWLNGDEMIIAKVRKKRKARRITALRVLRAVLTVLTIITISPASAPQPEAGAQLEDHTIGVMILSWRPHEGKLTKKGKRVGRGWVRGWAVDSQYRLQGTGSELLTYATRLCQQRRGGGGGGAGHNSTPDEGNIFFSPDHALSTHYLPEYWTKWAAKRDIWARRKLEDISAEVNEEAGLRRGSGEKRWS
jgi:hypothetical protein